MIEIPDLTAERIAYFWEGFKRNEETGCLEWQRYVNPHGYAQISVSGHQVYIHRIAYFLHYGVKPGDLLVCHHCDNPKCGEKSHLFLGTHSDNSQDAVRKDRWGPSGERHWAHRTPERVAELREQGVWKKQKENIEALNGENHPCTVLTAEMVREIKERSAKGESNKELAKAFGVTHSNISAIVLGKSWGHIEGAVRPKENRFQPKLTPAQVRDIRHKIDTGQSTAWKLGKALGMSPTTIDKVAKRQTWKHIK